MSPGALDAEVVRRHLFALDTALRHLRRYADRTRQDFEQDTDALWAAQHGLQLCAQNCLDVATHIVASQGVDAPDYASAVDSLGSLGVLTRPFAARLRNVAGFRNVLVHGYLELDLNILCSVLNDRLSDFEDFTRQVEDWLKTH